jgi:hypothetical protein
MTRFSRRTDELHSMIACNRLIRHDEGCPRRYADVSPVPRRFLGFTLMLRTTFCCLGLIVFGLPSSVWAQQTSKTNRRLQQALELYPDADTDKDGVLTMQEAQAHLAKLGLAGALKGPAGAVFNSEVFQATADELDAAMKVENAANQKEPQQFPKGNGLRIVSTGHSWVGPALRTLPQIAAAAGYDGQHVRSHTGGGGTGSANSIWKKEFGKYDDSPAKPILLPAIGTGQWDVMTWGAFYGDTPEHYGQWIDVCLKHNPRMMFFIQDGWPTLQTGPPEAPAADLLKAYDDRLAEMQQGTFQLIYESLGEKYPGQVHIIPAGAAVVDMLHRYHEGRLPGFDCASEHLGGTKGIYRDGGHLSRESGMEWLVGYLYYGTLYRKSPVLIEGLSPPNVHSEVDRAMREAAWKAIISSPYSGVTDRNGDGLGD